MNRIVVLDLIMIVSDGFLCKHVSESKKVDRCYQMRLMVTPHRWRARCSDHQGILLYTATGSTMVPSQNPLLEIGARII